VGLQPCQDSADSRKQTAVDSIRVGTGYGASPAVPAGAGVAGSGAHCVSGHTASVADGNVSGRNQSCDSARTRRGLASDMR